MRDEVDAIVNDEGWSKLAMQKMRRVDSFLKECQRIYGLGSCASHSPSTFFYTHLCIVTRIVSMSRAALKPFTFADGTYVPKGGMVSVASGAIHQDEEFYPDPHVFNPWRFSDIRDEEGEGVKHQLVATGTDYVPFGHGRHAWCVFVARRMTHT